MTENNIRKKDFKNAIKNALVGMNYTKYTNSRAALSFIGKMTFYSELLQATKIISCYDDNGQFQGVLLAKMKDEPAAYKSFILKLKLCLLYIAGVIISHEMEYPYPLANEKMFKKFSSNFKYDGEILFFCVNPKNIGKGYGTKLLNEFENKEKGKTVFLYTDSNCTWQFYEKRGYIRFATEKIEVKYKNQKTPLECYLYYKKIQTSQIK